MNLFKLQKKLDIGLENQNTDTNTRHNTDAYTNTRHNTDT